MIFVDVKIENEPTVPCPGSRRVNVGFFSGLVNASRGVGGASDLRCKTRRLHEAALEEPRSRHHSEQLISPLIYPKVRIKLSPD